MRLIDADVLNEELKSFFLTITGNPKQTEVVKECKRSFARMIDEQPTAYDPDKVVEQLEKHDYCEPIGWGVFGEILAIVKAGGIQKE